MSCGINPGSHCIGPRGWTTLHVGKIRFPQLRKWRANVGVEREAIDGVGFVRKGKNYRQEKFLR